MLPAMIEGATRPRLQRGHSIFSAQRKGRRPTGGVDAL
jgi:hypothetical protein